MMARLLAGAFACSLFTFGCGSSGGNSTPDAASVLSACGHPGDTGNSLGVGKYCKSLFDCTGHTNICSALGNGSTPNPNDTYFCTIYPCHVDAGAGECGEAATCVCGNSQGMGGGCACTPNSCLSGGADAGAARAN